MKGYRLNKKRFVMFILSVIAFIMFTIKTIDFIRFTECYLPTWKYQLQNEIEAGNEEAIEFYNRVYVANGRELFD